MDNNLVFPSCEVTESGTKVCAKVKHIDTERLISFVSSVNAGHCLALPSTASEEDAERFYYEIKPEQCTPISNQSYHTGTGSCILHPPLRYKPAADGRIDYSCGTDCNDSGTGWGSHSTATHVEFPALDYAFNSNEQGTLYFGAIWDIESLGIRCSGGSPIDLPSPYPCHGNLKGSVTLYCGAFRMINNSWSYIGGIDHRLLAADHSYTEFMDKYDPKSKMVASTAYQIQNARQGEKFCLRAGMKIVHKLDLDGIDGNVYISAKGKMRLMNYSYS